MVANKTMGDDFMYKTLGIIGGMGPLATVKLFEKIVLNTKADCDQEHVHILIDNNVNIPDRTNFILDKEKEDPRVELIKSAKTLERAGADFLVMPCNTAHNFYEDIVKEIQIPFLNMIEVTLEDIKKKYPNIKKIGLLSTEGTIKAKIYDNIFEKAGIEVVKPIEENQGYINDLIYNIKKSIPEENLDGVYKTMNDMKEEGVEVFIAGCTEISVALDLYKLEGSFVDPLDVLTERAIEFAGKKVNK